MLEIKEPTPDLFEKARDALLEIISYPTPFDIGSAQRTAMYAQNNFDGYEEYLKKNSAEEQPEGRVPATTFWLFDDDQIVGIFEVRHYLTETLKKTGGHIGYYIIPSCRGRGYALQGLKLVLKWCYEKLNLKEVLLFCNARNIRSDKVLTRALAEFGGRRLADQVLDDHIERGVWLKTK